MVVPSKRGEFLILLANRRADPDAVAAIYTFLMNEVFSKYDKLQRRPSMSAHSSSVSGDRSVNVEQSSAGRMDSDGLGGVARDLSAGSSYLFVSGFASSVIAISDLLSVDHVARRD